MTKIFLVLLSASQLFASPGSFPKGAQIKWLTDCDRQTLTRKEADLRENEIIYRTYRFTGNQCEPETQSMEFEVHETYSFAKSVSGNAAIDKTVVSYTLTLNLQALVDNYNETKTFGYDDWQLNVAKDIAGRKIAPDGQPYPSVGTKIYDIFRIFVEGEGGGYLWLWFGRREDGLDGATPEKRPTQLGEQYRPR